MTNFTKDNVDKFITELGRRAKERHAENVVKCRHVNSPFGGTTVVVELVDNDGVHDYFALFQNHFDGNADWERIVG